MHSRPDSTVCRAGLHSLFKHLTGQLLLGRWHVDFVHRQILPVRAGESLGNSRIKPGTLIACNIGWVNEGYWCVDNTIYISLARQMQLFREMDVVANNVANADTTGYKGESMTFTDYVIDAGRRRDVAFSDDIATVRNLEQGPLEATGNPLDVAIQGSAYFVVDAPEGERYTRAGSFTRNTLGEIVTAQGYPVQGQGGAAIVLDPADTDIKIYDDGAVTARNNNVIEVRGQLQLVTFDDPRQLRKISDTQFGAGRAVAAPAIPGEEYTLAQGMLENSNVTPVKEMTDMITVSRSVGGLSRTMNDLHDMTQRTINRLASQGQQ